MFKVSKESVLAKTKGGSSTIFSSVLEAQFYYCISHVAITNNIRENSESENLVYMLVKDNKELAFIDLNSKLA